MISSHVKISMISLLSSLPLKLNLNSLVYHRNIFGSSSEVFGNLRKVSENVRERSSGLQNNLGKSSENQKNRHHWLLYHTLARRYELFYELMARTISHSIATLTREILLLPLEHKIHIRKLIRENSAKYVYLLATV